MTTRQREMIPKWMIDWIRQGWKQDNLKHLTVEQKRKLIKIINKPEGR